MTENSEKGDICKAGGSKFFSDLISYKNFDSTPNSHNEIVSSSVFSNPGIF